MDKEQALKKIKELEEYVEELDSKSKAEQILEKHGSEIKSKNRGVYAIACVSYCKRFIKVPLPHANADWSFAAFDYVRRICGIVNETENSTYVYPVHYPTNDANFLYIKVK